MPYLIAFDLDGTLVDSRLDLATSANVLLREYGASALSVDHVASLVGEGARVLVTRVLNAAGVEADITRALDRFLQIYDEHLLEYTQLYPGVLTALQELEGRAVLALLTNKPERHTIRLIEALGIRHFFSQVVGGDGALPRKPDPAGLQSLIAAGGATPETTLMVGDSLVDVQTARRASTSVCVARYGFGHLPDDYRGEPGDLMAAAPTDLMPLLLQFVQSAPG